MNTRILDKVRHVGGMGGVVFSLMVGVSMGAELNTGTKLSPMETAKVMVARHLLEISGTGELSRLVQSKHIKSEDYWKTFFQARKKYQQFLIIRPDLMKSIQSIPLIGGASANSEQFVQAMLGSLRPMPLVPLHELTAVEQKKILEFARKPLRQFVEQVQTKPLDLSQESVELTLEAGLVFRSAAVTEGFNRLTQLSQDFHLQQKELELVEAKDRLNEMLHLYGLHLVIDGQQLLAGRLNLACYMVTDLFSYTIVKKPFVMYESWPLVEEMRNRALGQAEMEGGFLFLFGNRVDEQALRWEIFLSGKAGSPLRVRGNLTAETIKKVDDLVRAAVALSRPKTEEPKWVRARLIDSIGHHEGYHRLIGDSIDRAVEARKLSYDDAAAFHEKGAYLYQLESSDPTVMSLDLMMVLATALDKDVLVSDNRRGAAMAMAALQKALPRLRFWSDVGDVDPDGLDSLFRLPPAELKRAAAQARWDFEMHL